MKAKTKLTRLWGFLLALVMLLSLLPTTALAATYNDVKVNGVSLGDGEYLTSNAATAPSISSTEPTTYVAWYKNGVLTLNNFTGKSNSGIVLQGAPAADLIIKLIGNNTITPYDTGIQGNSAAGSITITADSGSNGNLTIDMTNSTRPVFGINGYTNSVTITGSADVKITAVATATNQESYGIKSSKAVSILDSASVSITCKTPNSTSRSDSCNGIFSEKNVTINTGGTIQIDVHEAGDEAYSYGINSMDTLTLTKVGGMTVKWKKAGVQGSPLLPSSASFDPTAYDTHKDTTDTTNCTATYMPKGTTPTTYTVSFDANGGSGTMADVTGVSGEYTLPANGFTAPAGKQFKAWSVGGSEKAVGDKITVTANTTVTAVWEPIPVKTYDLTTSVNGGHGTISAGENGITEGTSKIITFTPDSGYEIDKVMVNGTETTVTGNTLTVTMDGNKNVVVTYKAIEYTITVTDGKATVGAGSEISKAAEGTAVTLTANAAPSGKVFDKWEVVSGGITLADANSATTTFTMPAEAVSVKATYKTTPVTTYNLTTQVNGGHGTISANKTGLTAGSTETITFTPDAGYKIDTVTVNGTATSVSGNTLNVTMNENKTVVVTYKAIEYNITVTDGKATVGAGTPITKATMGTTVTLTANAAPTGKVFDKWEVVSGGITLADANSATTTFTMPAEAVSVKATYKTTPVTTYNLTTQVNGGHGTISANKTGLTAGSTETITFTPDAGYKIDTVTVNGTATSVSGNTLNVTMNENKTVVVTYKAIEYSITVTDGKATIGAGSEISKAAEGTVVTLTANAAPSGKVFDKWVVVSGGITLADANSATTTFTMPASAVSVKATYKNAPHTPTPTPTHTHNLTLVAAKAATCTEDGKEAYYKCEDCGKFYEDVLGTKEITDLASWGNIAKIAHTTKLKATSLTYNGKVRTPKVIVKDRTGKTLVKNTDYTVSYAKGRKYVGKYAVKITFKGKYSGTKTLYFTIKPKATSISSLTAGSKKFTVKWKKQATQTTGYQVQYSASSKFSKAKTVTVGKNTTVSKKISKLSGKKKYYVRVRTYKTVKINGKSIRIYSGWSKAKTVTTKK